MFLSAEDVKERVDGIIHEDTQFADKGIDLTVNKISRVSTPAELDFGGSEEKLGEVEEIAAEKRSAEDDYGWWKLERGVYIIEFNEEVSVEDEIGLIVPLDRLTAGGCFHSPLVIHGGLSGQPVLFVSSPGLNLKENARVSRLLVWR